LEPNHSFSAFSEKIWRASCDIKKVHSIQVSITIQSFVNGLSPSVNIGVQSDDHLLMTTFFIGKSYFFANSKSRSSCAGTAITAPVP
jgi:hypothetical protein